VVAHDVEAKAVDLCFVCFCASSQRAREKEKKNGVSDENGDAPSATSAAAPPLALSLLSK
jgi:hypothetical protein